MLVVKSFIKKQLQRVGIDIRKYPCQSPFEKQVSKFCDSNSIQLIFDIGANTGQFANQVFLGGYSGSIVSFEPLSEAWELLNSNAASNKNWKVHDRCAIGDRTGTVDVNISNNSFSSSILPMLDAHLSAARHSVYIGKESAPLFTLDSVAAPYLELGSGMIIKIDTQGYEWEVLAGATNTLSRASGIICELSLIPLYEGQRLWLDVIRFLESRGFELWAIQQGFSNTETGQSLQVDALFKRIS